ncbi:hypothetical protein EMIT0111MI5_50315 [Burkholderia sp. IT-111MI5]
MQPRPAASGRHAVAARQDRRGAVRTLNRPALAPPRADSGAAVGAAEYTATFRLDRFSG